MAKPEYGTSPLVVMGLWKVRDTRDISDILKAADEIARGEDRSSYRRLYVRRCSKDMIAIGFEYTLLFGRKDYYEAFKGKMHKWLTDRFGDDYCTWDVTHAPYVFISSSPMS